MPASAPADPDLAFYGYESGYFSAQTVEPSIHTPRDLYEALLHCWSAETCAPRMRSEWSPENPTLGQCSITAFLAQDLFGGFVCGVPLGDGNFHCYNVVDGRVFDLTSAQFLPRRLSYADNPVQSREIHFQKAEKRERYEALKASLAAYLRGAESRPENKLPEPEGSAC